MASVSNKNAIGDVDDKQGVVTTNQPSPVVISPPPPPPSVPEPPPVVISPVSKPEASPRESTANKLAYLLIIAFFVIAGVPLIVIFAAGGETMATKAATGIEWLKGVSAFLAGLVGAVIGYYFRAETAERS